MTYSRYLSLAAFLALTVVGGAAIGVYTAPGEWYASLAKPFFNPPNWVFGPVWTALYILIGIAGWRTWRRNYRGLAMQVWFGQLALNFLWSPVFFVGHSAGLALVIIIALLAAILAFIMLSRDEDRVAAWLFAPYALWVAFASCLNAAIVILN